MAILGFHNQVSPFLSLTECLNLIGGTYDQELTYIRCGDYYIPDIRLPEENRPIDRWDIYLIQVREKRTHSIDKQLYHSYNTVKETVLYE